MNPDVLFNARRPSAVLAQVLLLATLLTACGGGGGGDAAPAPASGGTPLSCPAPVATSAAALTSPAPSPAPAPTGAFVITGTATYDFVPTNTNGRGLNYAGTAPRPIRGANVQLLGAGRQLLATTTTDELGRYGFGLASAQPVTVSVRAEIKRTGAANGDRDFTVRDNTSGEALYVLDSAAFTPTAATTALNLNAPSGWGGNGYTGTRAAAPFAILDVVYAAQAKIATADPTVTLPPLKLFWSPNNQKVSGNLAAGNIGTSFFSFSGGNRSLYLLGKENVDTDEYDTHVVAHEFGHYLQSALSRDDSVGGSHSLGDRLDMRLAFSEGWGNAWSGMVLGSPIYADSSDAAQASGFSIDVSQPAQGSDRGWYSETSAQYLLWSVHQDPALGFAPVYAALRSLAAGPTFSSLYSFAAQLKAATPAAAAAITNLWGGQQIATQDNCGTGETNTGGDTANLPVYKQHTVALGVAQNYCVNTTAPDADNADNKLGRHVFILFAASGNRTITATRSGGNFAGASDPDLLLLKSDGSKVIAEVDTSPTQVLSTPLPTGTHVLALKDYNLTPPSTSCFNLTVN